jgi:hypothetical protein
VRGCTRKSAVTDVLCAPLAGVFGSALKDVSGGWSAGKRAPFQRAATDQRSSVGVGFEAGLKRQVNVGEIRS